MKIIFGLGNPEKKYDGTRHNVGFWVLDSLAKQWGVNFTPTSKFKARIAETIVDGEKTLLVKPDTYYNDVGQALRAIVDFYKLDTADILVIHDELMIEFGKIRVRSSGSDAGNNGIKSLIAHLDTDQFSRIRIGTGSALRTQATDYDFVLGRFSSDEHETLRKELLPVISDFIKQFMTNTLVSDSFLIKKPSEESNT